MTTGYEMNQKNADETAGRCEMCAKFAYSNVAGKEIDEEFPEFGHHGA